jgi:nitrous oxide reductase accessory protein NosL
MKKGKLLHNSLRKIQTVAVLLVLALVAGCMSSENTKAEKPTPIKTEKASISQPMEITQDDTCGRCRMKPAKYPQWQAQIIFKDGTMTPFEGNKCLFNFMNAMDQFDKSHTVGDVDKVLVKDFNTGEWLNGSDAYYVVGSKKMGPMGKELIPFSDQDSAMKFHEEYAGSVMLYSQIGPSILKALDMM